MARALPFLSHAKQVQLPSAQTELGYKRPAPSPSSFSSSHLKESFVTLCSPSRSVARGKLTAESYSHWSDGLLDTHSLFK